MTGSITVMAATSLTAAMEAITSEFEDRHPGVTVDTSFGSSGSLATSIVEGAPADVFASADIAQMDKVVNARMNNDAPVTFTTNSLEIMVRPGNPDDITGLADLADADIDVATAEDGAPIRDYTDTVLARAGVTAHFVTYEANVGGIVTKVTSGAADAGIVYRTDVIAAGSGASGVPIPDEQNVIAEYPITTLLSSTNTAMARAFVDFVLSSDGQAILKSFGFGER